MNSYFQFQRIAKDAKYDANYFTGIENVSNETILLLESDSRLGYFLMKKIPSGENFSFYVERSLMVYSIFVLI